MYDKKFQYFRFDNIFSYQRGRRLISQDQVPGDVAYISSTATNNGLDNYITPPEDMTVYNNKLTLSNSGSVGYLFYHNYDFVASDHVMVIWPIKQELNRYIAIFLKPIFEHLRYRYNFGREITDARLPSEQLYLPVDAQGQPDWQYMEDQVRSLERKINFKKIATKNRRESKSINADKWSEFSLTSLFNMSAGKYYPATEYDFGGTPLVSASEANNGVMAYTDLQPAYIGNCLTIGKVGMSVYYQALPFCASSDVTVLEPLFDGFDVHIAMFIISVLSKQKHQWNYGNQIRLNDSRRLRIVLPTLNDEPDWSFMRAFINTCPYAEYLDGNFKNTSIIKVPNKRGYAHISSILS